LSDHDRQRPIPSEHPRQEHPETLARRYSEIAHQDVQQARFERYFKTHNRETVRPVVLISEVPWGEIRDEALINTCSGDLAWLEEQLRRTLYQWDHFQVDLAIPPVFRVPNGYGPPGSA
jgi:hypothetical protein